MENFAKRINVPPDTRMTQELDMTAPAKISKSETSTLLSTAVSGKLKTSLRNDFSKFFNAA